MARKDISDQQVCEAVAYTKGTYLRPHEWLAKRTRQPVKVAYRALERARDHGLIDYGVSLASGWLTDEGIALLTEQPVNV